MPDRSAGRSAEWTGRLAGLDPAALTGHLCRQSWFRCAPEELKGAEVVSAQELVAGDRPILSALVEARHPTGTTDLYQLLMRAERGDGAGDDPAAVGAVDGWVLRDALDAPGACRAVLALALGRPAGTLEGGEVEPIGSETGSSSVRVGARVLKVYRELRPGPNVELEWLQTLGAVGFASVPALLGSVAADGRRLDTTLAIAQEHVGGAVAGPEHLRALAGDPEALADAAAALGTVIAALHAAVAAAPGAEAFTADAPTPESAALLLAALEDELDEALRTLPDEAEAEAVRVQAAEARERIRGLAGSGLGRFGRTHGDLRLRHAVWTERGWTLVGFQGDLAVAAGARRRKRPGLWDVACARRSLARVGEDHGGDPLRWRAAGDGLAQAYRAAVEPGLLPPVPDAADRLLHVLEIARSGQLIRRSDGDPDEQRRWTRTLHELLAPQEVAP